MYEYRSGHSEVNKEIWFAIQDSRGLIIEVDIHECSDTEPCIDCHLQYVAVVVGDMGKIFYGMVL